MREELGIDSEIDLIMKDNPMMTRDKAEKKFKQVLEDKLIKSSMALKEMMANGSQESDISSDDTDERGQAE